MDDLICSEINASVSYTSREGSHAISKILVTSPPKQQVDEDGDLILTRKHIYLEVEHRLSSSLYEVGTQIWTGSMIIGDFLLDSEYFQGNKVIELGAGTGITAMSVMATASNDLKITSYWITDLPEIIPLIHRNLEHNSSKFFPHWKEIFSVYSLDFREKHDFLDFDVIVAGDIIYDNDITDALVDNIIIPMSSNVVLYLAIELRFVFTLEDMKVVAPAYCHLLRRLESMPSIISFKRFNKLPKKSLCYNRSSDSILIEIKKIT